MDGRTTGGIAISPVPGPTAPAGDKNLCLCFFMLGPYIKSRGTRGTEMSANADLITLETYVQHGETI